MAKGEEGLDYILSHFEPGVFRPRTISTKATEGRQVPVSSREDALAKISQANWVDCRISAYPLNVMENPSAVERFQGLANITPRNIVVIIDLDKSTFKSERALKMALAKTCRIIKDRLGSKVTPTIIWSGNGYHIYLVLDSEGIVLENIKELSDLKVDQISIRFLRFVERYLSEGKSDLQHNYTVSFNNCMLRIPGSYNLKCLVNGKDPEVRIIQKWNGYRPSMKLLLLDFYVYLWDQRIKELEDRKHRQTKRGIFENSNNAIQWIENLLRTPIADYRKLAIWRILAPYLLNKRRLSYEQAYDIIKNWLNECSNVERLRFNANQKIRDGLRSASKGYFPISYENLKIEYKGFYTLLHNRGVLT